MESDESIDSVEAMASALDSLSEGRITWDEFNIIKHDKRYHPHGYRDQYVCKYREGSSKSCAIREHYAKIEKEIDSGRTCDLMFSECGIVFCDTIKAEELCSRYDFSLSERKDIEELGKPLGHEMHERHIKTVYAICRDIKGRFPRFSLDNTKIISWAINENIGWFSASTLDRRNWNDTGYIALGNIYNKENNVPTYHVVRHEMGHSLSTNAIFAEWISEIIINAGGAQEFLRYAGKHISKYAGRDVDEALAEAFANYTDPFYTKGEMPSWIEKVVEHMLGNDTKEGTMDSAETRHRGGIKPINPSYYMSGHYNIPDFGNKIVWLDNVKGFLQFKSYDDKFRYAMRVFGVPDEWVVWFLQKKTDNKWSDGEIHFIAHMYRDTEMSITEVYNALYN